MRCPECDHDLSDDARYCHVCGAAQSDRSRRAGRTSTRKRESGNRVRGNQGLGSRDDIAERDETALWRGSFSAKGLIHSWLMAILLTIVMPIGASMVSASTTEWLVILTILALVWGGLGVFLAIQKLNVHYELTDQRLIHRSGILLRRTNRIELIDMDDVGHEQGLIERFFDVGTIEIASSDRSHPLIQLPGISNVEEIAMLIDDARRRERIRRGIHIEQI